MEYGSVIFDMDGVILNSLVDDENWKFEAVREALRDKNVDPEGLSRSELGAVMGDQGYKEVVRKSAELGLDPGEIWRHVAFKTTEARAGQIRDGNFEIYDGARQVIEFLHSEDVELGIISNAPEKAVEATIEYYDLKKYFKFYAGVRNFEDLQARKPNPNHLELAKAELKRKPMVYVGDAESDVIAAQRADLDSIWVNRSDSRGDVQPDYEISEMREMEELVR
jgi:phosphoglycolate phosphatase-like HAD superfamily hydrolase